MGRIVLRLDRMMVERGRSLNWLADRVGITNVNLSKIKNNHVTAIRFSTLAAICEALDCRPGDILDYVEDDTPECSGQRDSELTSKPLEFQRFATCITVTMHQSPERPGVSGGMGLVVGPRGWALWVTEGCRRIHRRGPV